MKVDDCSILLVSSRFPPEIGAGATRVEALTQRWASQGADVTVLTSVPDYPEGKIADGYRNRWLQREEREGVTVLMTKTFPAGASAGLIRQGLKYVWFVIAAVVVGIVWTSPKVVIATSPPPFTGLTGWLIAKAKRTPFVYEIRDLWPESFTAMKGGANRAVILIIGSITGFLRANADAVVGVTPGMVSRLVDEGIDPSKVWLHTNGIQPESIRNVGYAELPPEDRERLQSKFIVSHIGTVGPAQDLSVLVDAAEIIQREPGYEDVRFAIVGFGSEYSTLRERCRSEGVANVLFFGERPGEQVPEFLDRSDAAVIHTRRAEVFEMMLPVKLYEAMAAGLPVILGMVGDAADLVRREETGIVVTPGTPEELAAAVKTLHDDQERARRLGRNGRRYVERNHDWDVISCAYYRDLRSLIADRS